MAKLRLARTKEEAERVPLDQPIQIEIPADGSIVEPEETVEVKEAKPEKKAAPVVIERELEPEPDETKALKERLEAAEKAEKVAQAAAEESRLRAEEYGRREQEAIRQRAESQVETEEARYVAILNALDAAEAEAGAAQAAWAEAEAAGDIKAKSDANRRLARAEAAISRHAESKDIYEANKKKAPEKVEAQPATDFESRIAQLPEAAKTWLRGHPEYVNDQRKNVKIQSLHYDIIEEGHPAFTPAYFDAMDIKLGFKQPPKETRDDDEDDAPPPPPQRRTVVTSAPPTREAPSAGTGRAESSRIVLTQEQREIARSSGISEIEYGRQLMKLNGLKKDGHYQGGQGR